MLILANGLRKKPIITPISQKIGEIGDIIIDPKNGQLLGFKVQNGLISQNKIISVADILAMDQQVIILNSQENLLPQSEIVRMDKKIKIIGAKAYTESNQYLGKVEDVVIETETMSIVKYYIRHIVKSRILPSDQLIEIKTNKIIFSDIVTNPPVITQSVTA
jgi:uncharacterized protein YrrD